MNTPVAAAKAAPTPTLDSKQKLGFERERIQQRFAASAAPRELLRRLSAVVDRELRAVWKNADLPAGLALLAVGGYGRGELYPYSDVDLLVLLPRPADAVLGGKLERLIGTLWDIG